MNTHLSPEQYKTITTLPWITEPAIPKHEPLHRRARTLAWVLVALILLCSTFLLSILLSNLYDNATRNLYITLTTSLLFICLLAYTLNIFGRYCVEAILTIAVTIIGIWVSVLLDNTILTSNLISIVYTILPVFLASLLLSVRASIFVAIIQFIALYSFPLFFPFSAFINWSSLLSFFLIASGISILTNLSNQKDMQQIEEQTIELANTSARLREASFRDPLTKLFNRRYLVETLERELHRSTRENSPLGVLILDVDYFKKINDSFGHAAGDMVLIALGKCLQEYIRKSDIACPYGGEEFVLILPGASLDTVISRAEYLREEISHFQMEYKDQIIEGLTISVGVSVFPEHGTDKDRLLNNADDALYQAKRAGRNQVLVFQPD